MQMIPLANTDRCAGCKGGRGDGERGELRRSEWLGFEPPRPHRILIAKLNLGPGQSAEEL